MMVVIKDKVVGAEKNIGIDMRRFFAGFPLAPKTGV
jgi:hypothetical protein